MPKSHPVIWKAFRVGVELGGGTQLCSLSARETMSGVGVGLWEKGEGGMTKTIDGFISGLHYTKS